MKVNDIIVENTGTIEQQAAEYFKQENTPSSDQQRFMNWLKSGKARDPKTQKPYADFYRAQLAYNKLITTQQAPAADTQPEKQRSANFRGNQYTGGIPGERNDDNANRDDIINKPKKGVISKVSRGVSKVSKAVQQGKQTARAAGDKTQSYMDKLSRISNIGVTR